MRLLADRESHGITVRLYWDRAAAPGHEIVVTYRDRDADVAYKIHPPSNRALDAFYHPNCYLDSAEEALITRPQAA
jgi:hypothetical protein